MRSRTVSLLVLLFSFASIPAAVPADPAADVDPAAAPDLAPAERLVVLWTSGDREVALKTVFIYVYNARKYGWWSDITFIIWGPSSRLLAGDAELQAQLADMQEVGVTLTACKWCSDQYGVSAQLAELGVDVKYMGKELTEYIQAGRHVLTF